MKKIAAAIVLFAMPAHSQVQSSCTWDIETTNLATKQVVHYRPSPVSSIQLPSIQGWNCFASQIGVDKSSDGSIWEKVRIMCTNSDSSAVGIYAMCKAFPNKMMDDETLAIAKGTQGFLFTLTCK